VASQEVIRVSVDATIENLVDVWDAERGRIAAEDVPRVRIREALVDTRVMGLALPTGLIRQLGLQKRSERRVTTSDGDATAQG